MQLRALDLFCGAGGVTKGLQRAGFHVTGVDLAPQKNYCGDVFHQTDALWTASSPFLLREFDFIWASPPCQAYSQAAQGQRLKGKVYPDLIAPVRAMLDAAGVSYVLENVPKSPLRVDLTICGCQVGLKLRRVRWFEATFPLLPLPAHKHDGPVVSVVGHGTPTWARQKLGFKPSIKHYREAMGIDWMNRNELSQAIPPAYSEYIARQFLGYRASLP